MLVWRVAWWKRICEDWRWLFESLFQGLLGGVFDHDLIGALDGSSRTDSFALSAVPTVVSRLDVHDALTQDERAAFTNCQTETASVTELGIDDRHIEHIQPLTTP